MADDITRFLKYVERTDSCWNWTGARTPRGYGRFYFEGRLRYSHRVAIRLFLGTNVPAESVVLHRCDNPPCVNPDHLSIGTQADNMRDAAAKGRIVNNSDWRGQRNPKSKLTAEQLESLQSEIIQGDRTSRLAAKYGVSRVRIQQIKRQMKAGGGWKTEVFE